MFNKRVLLKLNLLKLLLIPLKATEEIQGWEEADADTHWQSLFSSYLAMERERNRTKHHASNSSGVQPDSPWTKNDRELKPS